MRAIPVALLAMLPALPAPAHKDADGALASYRQARARLDAALRAHAARRKSSPCRR